MEDSALTPTGTVLLGFLISALNNTKERCWYSPPFVGHCGHQNTFHHCLPCPPNFGASKF